MAVSFHIHCPSSFHHSQLPYRSILYNVCTLKSVVKWQRKQESFSVMKAAALRGEADSDSASQEIPRLLCNPKVHYRVHNSPLLHPIFSQMNPIPTFPPYFPKIHCNTCIRFSSTPKSSEWSVPYRLPTKILYVFLISLKRTIFPAHLILLDSTTLIIFVEEYTLWSSSFSKRFPT
jgi:hypothetical protein